MASCESDLNLQRPQSDTYPLLMDHSNAAISHDCAVNILPESPEGLQECTGPCMPARCGNAITAEASNTSLASSSSHTYLNPPDEQLGRTETYRNQDHATNDSGQQRRRHLGSRLWTAIEMMLTISQIIASTVVLSISRHEKPKAPLFLWILGYTAGCLASLPVLYWRYASRNVDHLEHEQRLASSEVSTASSPTSPGTSHTLSQSNLLHNDDPESGGHGDQAPHSEESRIGVHIDRMKVGLECFFAVWFVVGNVWIFGGHSSYHDAPNLYRLCIVFLTFSCIGYAMPFVICATICCCLPCIITLLGYREDHGQVKGATSEIIEALPIYKFKIKGSSNNACKDVSDSESEDPGQEGIFAAGTERERFISSEDAVCCICLGKYRDGMDLKELPCAHFFHVECVDKWLKINGSCPLCKHELKGFDDQSELPTTTAAGA